ncbi:hypothetical protein L484_025414 [Morus notabilis]|uniref:DUF674 family protein n=1 Tax=Morus notabilis TaxID=981085 RepID=W9RQU2_9ROSA|nr:uncharacterized protein LOC21408115 [Morus notabilis]EXB65333.1 hypothetical protein L484_025414 [Morus notabilis]
MSTTKPSISLKLLVDKKAKRVLLSEAGKDFVDFLLSLLSLPIGTVIRILSTDGMLGSLGNLYQSFENLSETYIQPEAKKDTLLKPNLLVFEGAATLLALPDNADQTRNVFTCGNCKRYVTYNPKDKCPNCGWTMSTLASFANQAAQASSSIVKGYVKDVVTYMIMDDLEVKPMSTISSIALLNKYKVKDICDLAEVMVSFGMDEALKFLKASLESKTVLTDVFLGEDSSRGIPI